MNYPALKIISYENSGERVIRTKAEEKKQTQRNMKSVKRRRKVSRLILNNESKEVTWYPLSKTLLTMFGLDCRQTFVHVDI